MRRSAIIWLVLTLCLLSATPSITAGGPASLVDIVNVVLKTNTVKVRTLRDTQVEVRLRDAGGRLRARTERLVPAAGIQDVSLLTASGFPAIIHPGDSVVITPEGGESLVITPVYLDVRPVASTDTIFLEGPPNAELQVQLQVPGDVLPGTFTVTTDEGGAATLDLAGSVNLGPGVGGWVAYPLEAKRAVLVSFQVPTVVAKVGSDWVEGYVWADREVSLTLEDDAGQPIAATRLLADGTGYFSTRLAEQFAGLRIHPGQTIRITWEDQEIALAVPELSIRADPETDRIIGRGPAGANLSVTIYDQSTGRRQWYHPTTDQNGQYQVNLAGLVDINPDDDGSVVYQTPERHKLVADFRVPFVKLEVGSHRISGRGVENAGVIADLRASDGVTIATAQTTVDTRGNFALELKADGQPVPVAAGDMVQVTVGDEQIAMDVPALSVHLDPDEERVFGQGPPGELVELSLVAGDNRLTEQVIPDAAGTYSLEVSGRADIRAGTLATVTYTTPDEHRISAQDRLTRMTVQVGANHIEGTVDPDKVVDVFLRRAGGQLKDWARTTASSHGQFAVDTAVDCRSPMPIEPTDEIVVRTGEEEATLIAPDLTVTLDPESDQVTGTGPAGASVQLRLSASDGYRQDEITIDGDGRYNLTYAPNIDIRPGDQVVVSWISPEGHEVFARANVPEFSATIGDAVLRGSITPLGTIHVALRDRQGTLKAEATAIGNRNGSFALMFRGDAGQPVPIEAGDSLNVEAGDTTYQVPVPPLSLALDPAGPTATGNTLPGATVDLIFITQSGGYVQRTLTADANGDYETAFAPDIAVRAGDWARARITTPEGLGATALWSAPFLTAYAGTNYVRVQMVPRIPVTVTLSSRTGDLRAVGRRDPADGDAYFFTSHGQPVAIQPGDRITLEQAGVGEVAAMTVPELRVNLDPKSNAVQGSGPAGSQVFVSVSGRGGEGSRNASVPVWADGTYTARFVGLDPGPGGSARVSYADPETGHRTVRETYRGWFRAHIGENVVDVRAEPLSEVTLSLQGAGGATKSEVGSIQVDHRGRGTVELWTRNSTPARIQAGDYLELTAADGVTGLTIPSALLGIDTTSNQVFGAVPGPGTTSVTLSTAGGCTYQRHLRPAPDGHFQANFAYDADIGPGDSATLRFTTAAGHQLEIRRVVHAMYLPLIALD